MSKQKKVILTLILLLCTMMAAVIAITLIFSAQKASSVKSGVNVQYTPPEDHRAYLVIENNIVTGLSTEGENANLTELVIPNGVTGIADKAFYGKGSLKSVTLPSTCKSIGDEAFYNTNLHEINLPSGLESIGRLAFWGAGLSYSSGYTFDIIIPASVTSIGYGAFSRWRGVNSLEVESDNPIYKAEGNCVIEKASNKLISGTFSSSNIPDGVETIGRLAFYWSMLGDITLPESVTTIEYGAFAYASLGDVVLPKVTTIDGGFLFSSISSVDMPNVTNITNNAFNGCKNLLSIAVSSDNPVYYVSGNCLITKSDKTLVLGCKASVIPSNVISIGNSAFSNCTGLTSINLPTGLTSIGDYAFRGCTGLITINWNATKLTSHIYSSTNIFYNAGNESTEITVTIGENVEELPCYLFYCSDSSYRPNITSVVLPSGSTWIYSTTSGATTGTEVNVSASELATNLKDTWKTYYLIRTDN